MGDHSLGCGKSGDRIARHNMLRDVIFETASSADLGPIREESLQERHLLLCQRKVRDTADACRREGLVFLPFAMETLGGLHPGAVTQVKLLASSLARSKGSDEREATSQLFGRLSLNLMRGNALMLSSRCQDNDIPLAEVDGVWNIPKCITFHD